LEGNLIFSLISVFIYWVICRGGEKHPVITGKVSWVKKIKKPKNKKNRRKIKYVYWVGVPGIYFRGRSPSQKFNKKSLE
jgi:hypothetical protein